MSSGPSQFFTLESLSPLHLVSICKAEIVSELENRIMEISKVDGAGGL